MLGDGGLRVVQLVWYFAFVSLPACLARAGAVCLHACLLAGTANLTVCLAGFCCFWRAAGDCMGVTGWGGLLHCSRHASGPRLCSLSALCLTMWCRCLTSGYLCRFTLLCFRVVTWGAIGSEVLALRPLYLNAPRYTWAL